MNHHWLLGLWKVLKSVLLVQAFTDKDIINPVSHNPQLLIPGEIFPL